MVHPATTAVAKAATKGGLLSAAAKALSIGSKANEILHPILTRPIGNVSESTCQGCRVKPLPEIPKQETNIHAPKPCPNCIHYEAEGGDTYYLDKMKRENIEEVENSPGSGFPIIGNLIKAGRYEVKFSYHREARGALKDAGVEVATWYIGGKLVSGIKYLSLVSTAETSGNALVTTGIQWSKHSLERLAERGVTKAMAELAIKKGQKFFDPVNKSINYILSNGFGSGKSLLVGTNPFTGEVTTVIRSSKNLINKRFIPIQ